MIQFQLQHICVRIYTFLLFKIEIKNRAFLLFKIEIKNRAMPICHTGTISGIAFIGAFNFIKYEFSFNPIS
jgi:hypothetical protein